MAGDSSLKKKKKKWIPSLLCVAHRWRSAFFTQGCPTHPQQSWRTDSGLGLLCWSQRSEAPQIGQAQENVTKSHRRAPAQGVPALTHCHSQLTLASRSLLSGDWQGWGTGTQTRSSPAFGRSPVTLTTTLQKLHQKKNTSKSAQIHNF